VSNYWPANTAYTAGSCVAYFYNDQNIVYEIQADGSMAQTSIGNEYNFNNVTAGSTTTGLSQATLEQRQRSWQWLTRPNACC
jgi:predicted transcriptional regulator